MAVILAPTKGQYPASSLSASNEPAELRGMARVNAVY